MKGRTDGQTSQSEYNICLAPKVNIFDVSWTLFSTENSGIVRQDNCAKTVYSKKGAKSDEKRPNSDNNFIGVV